MEFENGFLFKPHAFPEAPALVNFLSTNGKWEKAKAVRDSRVEEREERSNDVYAISIDPSSTAEEWDQKLFKAFNQGLKEYVEHIGYGDIVDQDEGYNILRYVPGQKYDMHFDNSDLILSHRKISAILYLNDNFHGGYTEFPLFGKAVKPQAGALLLFPSDWTYKHRALEPIGGHKYCAVTWFFRSKKEGVK